MSDTITAHAVTYAVRVEWDHDHAAHVAAELRAATDPDETAMRREELDNLEDGTWGAYGVVLVRVCGCCHAETVDYGHALWGCVVEWDCEYVGTYDNPAAIRDPHLREVAAELITEVGA